jgi:stage III sporulation protein AG
MKNSEERVKSIFKKFTENKKAKYLIVAILSVVIIFIFITSFFGSSSKSENTIKTDDYVAKLEKSLEKTLSLVQGAGNVSVVITVESGMETVLAMETVTKQTSSTTEIVEKPLIVNGKPIVLKEKNPKIIGVLIVAQGAKNISVLTKMQQATVSLLDININQIEILTMK